MMIENYEINENFELEQPVTEPVMDDTNAQPSSAKSRVWKR